MGNVINRTKLTVLAVGAALALSACQSTMGPKQEAGMLTGAIVGGVVGNQIGGGTGKDVATGLGVIVGAMVGGGIGESLDRVDRQYMAQANQKAFETAKTNSSVDWVNPDTGNSGTVTPTRTYESSRGVCREFTQTVLVGGRNQQAYGTACRQTDGSWKIIQ